MEYFYNIYDTIQDIYNQWYFEYNVPTYKINEIKIKNGDENEDEINKIINDVKNEIRIDNEIKQLEQRYHNLCNFVNEDGDNNEEDEDKNKNNNNNAVIKSKNKNKLKLKNAIL